MHFTGAKPSPYIMLLLEHKNVLSSHGGFPTNAMHHNRETIKSNLKTLMKQRQDLMTHRQSELKKTPS